MKEPNKVYARECRKCFKMFFTPGKKSKLCPDCDDSGHRREKFFSRRDAENYVVKLKGGK